MPRIKVNSLKYADRRKRDPYKVSHTSIMNSPNNNRRSFITTLGAIAATPLLGRDYGPDAPPVRYPEPDVVTLEPSF